MEMENSKEDCAICLHALPKFALQFARLTCCGKGLHLKCSSQLMYSELNDNCPLCRQPVHEVNSPGELKEIQKWSEEKGAPWAQDMLGAMYGHGQSVSQSWTQAVHYYTLAANKGYPESQWKLASRYLFGQGVDQSFEQARYWFEQAAAQGFPQALANLGQLYANGWGVPQDLKAARAYMMKAKSIILEDMSVENASWPPNTCEDIDKMLQWVDSADGVTDSALRAEPDPVRCCSFCKLAKDSQRRPLKKCARCQSVFYCDRICQKKHWKAHKKECASLLMFSLQLKKQ
jgi:hypothetical protein